eukprot:CAMPEP_0115046966 /NCGR_PEP_ID=MMETSP0216-20121206/49041_1 /TAXON_ID=223996 /ORGANISM="Protocruzia adherens, Strain Boccale" /LENGTH=731 /DNA_ID=CAMNT_0002430103 /DNA_START=269 /DNA_END=2464 /DNA_ORIENTATION=-
MQQSAKVADAVLSSAGNKFEWLMTPINKRFKKTFSFCSFVTFFFAMGPAMAFWSVALMDWSNPCQQPLETFLFVQGLLFSTLFMLSSYLVCHYGAPLKEDDGNEEEMRKRAEDAEYGEVIDERQSKDDLNARISVMVRDPVLIFYVLVILFGVCWTVVGNNWFLLVTSPDQGDPGFTENSVCVRTRPHLIRSTEAAINLFWVYLAVGFGLALFVAVWMCRQGQNCFFDEEERRVREEDRLYKQELEENARNPGAKTKPEQRDIKRPGRKQFSQYPWRDRNQRNAQMQQQRELGSALLAREGIPEANQGAGPRTIIMGDLNSAIRMFRDVSVQSGQSVLQGRYCCPDNAASARVQVSKPYRDPHLGKSKPQTYSHPNPEISETEEEEEPEKKKGVKNKFKKMGTKIKGAFVPNKKKKDDNNGRGQNSGQTKFRSEVVDYNTGQTVRPHESTTSKSVSPPLAREKTFVSRSERGSNIDASDAVYFQDIVVEEVSDTTLSQRGNIRADNTNIATTTTNNTTSPSNRNPSDTEKSTANQKNLNLSTCSTLDYSYCDPNEGQDSDKNPQNSEVDGQTFDGSRKKTVNDPLNSASKENEKKEKTGKNMFSKGHKVSVSGTELQDVAFSVAKESDRGQEEVRYDAYLRSEKQREEELSRSTLADTPGKGHHDGMSSLSITPIKEEYEDHENYQKLSKKEKMRRLLADEDEHDGDGVTLPTEGADEDDQNTTNNTSTLQ